VITGTIQCRLVDASKRKYEVNQGINKLQAYS